MSYIAKIYLNKMFKKDDCLRIDENNNLVIKVRNVLNPIPLGKPPKRAIDHLEVKGDGELLNLEGLKAKWKGKEYDDSNSAELEGQVVELGDEYEVYFPNRMGWKSGETHELEIKIIQDRPILIKIKRTIK
ncbi:MAG: hypothetical protein ACTSU2_14210 [Promethearchaeota archaeon]